MAKKPAHGLKETKGLFKVRGLANIGDVKDATFDSGAQKISSNIGINTTSENKVYVSIGGYVKDIVRFYSKEEKVCEEVAYKNRNVFKKDGYDMMGVTVGVEKDDNGKNISHVLQEFEVPKYLRETLKANSPMFVTGKLEFSSFSGKDGNIIRKRDMVPQKIYSSKDIDFESSEFEEVNSFKQTIIYEGIEKVAEGRFAVSAYVVGYRSIEKVEFIIENATIAGQFKKNLKSGHAIDVFGKIVSERVQEEVAPKDMWGEADPFKTTVGTKTAMLITGADPSTIDKESYSIEIILKKIKEISEAREAYGKTKVESEEAKNKEWGDNLSKDADFEDSDDSFPF